MQLALVYADRKRNDKWPFVEAAARRVADDAVRIKSLDDLRECEADVVLFEQRSGPLNDVDLVDAAEHKPRGQVWVQWWFDLIDLFPGTPFDKQPILNDWLHVLRAMDIVLTKELSNVKSFRKLGINAHYFDQACPKEMPACTDEPLQYDAAIIGSADRIRYPGRHEAAQMLVAAGRRVAWAQSGSGSIPDRVVDVGYVTPTDGFAKLCSKSACLIDDAARFDIVGYWSDRLWLGLGCGAVVVRKYTSGLPGYVRMYQTIGQLLDAVEDCVQRRNALQKHSVYARGYVMQYNTYDRRIEQLLELVEHHRAGGD